MTSTVLPIVGSDERRGPCWRSVPAGPLAPQPSTSAAPGTHLPHHERRRTGLTRARGMVISGDWNSDGWDDLAVPVPTGNNVTLALTAPRLALPTAAAFSLTPLAASGAGGVTAADWNGDGKLDLAVSRAPLNQVTLFLSGP